MWIRTAILPLLIYGRSPRTGDRRDGDGGDDNATIQVDEALRPIEQRGEKDGSLPAKTPRDTVRRRDVQPALNVVVVPIHQCPSDGNGNPWASGSRICPQK